MASFTLTWSNTALINNNNVTGVRVEYKQKLAAGNFTVSPPDPLDKSITSKLITGLLDNVVYQFKIAALCTAGGPTGNDNGTREAIKFACVSPTETHTDTTATISVVGLPADIKSVRFTLGGVTITNNTSGGSVSNIFTGLTPGASYTATIELIASVNAQDVASTFGNCFVGVTTTAAAACSAPTNLAVSAS